MTTEQVSFRIDPSVVARMRGAVRHHRGHPLFLNLNKFVESAIDRAVKSLEAKHNGGKPYVAVKGRAGAVDAE